MLDARRGLAHKLAGRANKPTATAIGNQRLKITESGGLRLDMTLANA